MTIVKSTLLTINTSLTEMITNESEMAKQLNGWYYCNDKHGYLYK